MHTQRGVALLLMLIVLIVGIGVFFVTSLNVEKVGLARAAHDQRVLVEAREALVAHAVSKKFDPSIEKTPFRLPCPDLNDDGVAESGCGNLTGSTGQPARLGRLPWRTLGIDDLRDSSGERLWYAVSSKYNPKSVASDLNPSTGLGTITVRDSTGTVFHDGTSADETNTSAGGAVAIVIAPGEVLKRLDASMLQDRSCVGGACNASDVCTSTPATATPKCNAVNYLDIALGEDNATFIDRNDARAGNTDGFISGPVPMGGGIVVNDTILPITYNDIMPAISRRVAIEVSRCLHDYAAVTNNANRYPWPAPICRQGLATPSWADHQSVLFGRVPDAPFDNTKVSVPMMSDQWGPTCNIHSGAEWWPAWKMHVFIAIANAYRPTSADTACVSTDPSSCLQIRNSENVVIAQNKPHAVLVAGARRSGQARGGANDGQVVNYLETTNQFLGGMIVDPLPADCGTWTPVPSCTPLSSCSVTVNKQTETANDVVIVPN